MADPFLGEIRIFAGNFAPRGWALCAGQTMTISDNDALFSLIGTIYGGDGRSTFMLPDLRSRLPVHQGQGAGLTPRLIGSRYGAEEVTLDNGNLPPHTHTLMAGGDATTDSPVGNLPATAASGVQAYTTTPQASAFMAANMLEQSGGTQPHTNLMPVQALNYIICLNGLYPSRN